MAKLAPAVRRSPLAHRQAIEAERGTARIRERPFLGKFILRADREIAAGPLRTALGFGLPFDALTSSAQGENALLWMGPDEWMLVTRLSDGPGIEGKVTAVLAGTHHQLVNVTDYYTVIEVAGNRARELLMKLTTLDLHHRAFRPGMVTGSVFGKANATIWLPLEDGDVDGPAFQLFVRWSIADYLWCLLANAGREWGMPEQVPIKDEQLTISLA